MDFLKSVRDLVGDSLVFKDGDHYYAGQITDTEILNTGAEVSYDYNNNVLVNEDGSTVPAIFLKYSEQADVWYSKDPIKILPDQGGYVIVESETSWTEPDLTEDVSLMCTVETCDTRDTKPVARDFAADRKPSALTGAVYTSIDTTGWAPNEYVELGEGLTSVDGRPILGKDGKQIIEVWYLNPTTNHSVYNLPPGAVVRDFAVTTVIGRQFQELKDQYNALILKGQAEAKKEVAAAVAAAPTLAAAVAVANTVASSGPKYSELPEIRAKFKELQSQRGGALKDPERWAKMKKSGVPEPGIRRKMAEAGESPADIDALFSGAGSTQEVSEVDLSEEGIAELAKLVASIKANPRLDTIKPTDTYPLFTYSGTTCKVKDNYKKKAGIGIPTTIAEVKAPLTIEDFIRIKEFIPREKEIGFMYKKYSDSNTLDSFAPDVKRVYPDITSEESLRIIQEQIDNSNDEKIVSAFRVSQDKNIDTFFAAKVREQFPEVSLSHVRELLEKNKTAEKLLGKPVNAKDSKQLALGIAEAAKLKAEEFQRKKGVAVPVKYNDAVSPYESLTKEEDGVFNLEHKKKDEIKTLLETLKVKKDSLLKLSKIQEHHIRDVLAIVKDKEKLEKELGVPQYLKDKAAFIDGSAPKLTTDRRADGTKLPAGWKLVVNRVDRTLKYQTFEQEGGKVVAKLYDSLPVGVEPKVAVPPSSRGPQLPGLPKASSSGEPDLNSMTPAQRKAAFAAKFAALAKGGTRRIRKIPTRRSRSRAAQ